MADDTQEIHTEFFWREPNRLILRKQEKLLKWLHNELRASGEKFNFHNNSTDLG